jgi:hypothetical protein
MAVGTPILRRVSSTWVSYQETYLPFKASACLAMLA